jgi:cytochrome b561
MSEAYSKNYRIVHWAMAILILMLLPVGLYMHNLPDSNFKNQLYALHKSFGLLVLAFAFLRVFMRIKAGKVAPVATLTPFERKASSAVHHLLFALVIIVPLSGYLGVSACCAPLQFLGLGNFALPLSLSEAAMKRVFLVHEISSKLMLVLVLTHMSAALFHHFVKKDTVLTRMLRG